jgi:hypothetical protein
VYNAIAAKADGKLIGLIIMVSPMVPPNLLAKLRRLINELAQPLIIEWE